MTTYYMDNGGDDTDGLTRVKAFTTWSNVPALNSGDIVLVHTGSTNTFLQSAAASITFTGPSSGAPAYIIGVDMDTSVTVINESASDNFVATDTTSDLLFDGSLVVIGIHFKSGDRINFQTSDGNESGYFQLCNFDCQVDLIDNIVGFGQFIDCDFILGSGGKILIGASSISSTETKIYGGTITGSGVCFDVRGQSVTCIGVDFSGYTGSTFVDWAGNEVVTLIGCRLPSTFPPTDNAYGALNIYGSGTTSAHNVRTERLNALSGSCVLTESIYRDGGATYDGTNEYSWKLSADTDNNTAWPVYTDWHTGYIAADSGTQTTWTVYICNLTSAGGTLQNDDCWLEVEYFSNASYPLKTIATSKIQSVLATPANITADGTSTWTGIVETAQKLSVTKTVNLSGMYRWRVASTYTPTDVYVCPKADVTQA